MLESKEQKAERKQGFNISLKVLKYCSGRPSGPGTLPTFISLRAFSNSSPVRGTFNFRAVSVDIDEGPYFERKSGMVCFLVSELRGN